HYLENHRLAPRKSIFKQSPTERCQARIGQNPGTCQGAGEWEWNADENAGQQTFQARDGRGVVAVMRLQTVRADAACQEANDRRKWNGDAEGCRLFGKKKPIEAHDQQTGSGEHESLRQWIGEPIAPA